jgi:hypothetical protein
MNNVIDFPNHPANINRKMERILDTARDIEQRSEDLLRFANEYWKEGLQNDVDTCRNRN